LTLFPPRRERDNLKLRARNVGVLGNTHSNDKVRGPRAVTSTDGMVEDRFIRRRDVKTGGEATIYPIKL
jgi:hypothetical protein